MARMDCWSCHSHSAQIAWDDSAGMLDHRVLFALDGCPLLSPIRAKHSSGNGGRWKRLRRSVCSYLHSSAGGNGGGKEEKKAAWNAVVESLMQRHPGSQLPERLISMIRRHFELLPLSYARAGLASDQVFLHIRLVEQAHIDPHAGSIAISIDQDSISPISAAARSSNASEEYLSMSSPPSPASWADHDRSELLTITFATIGTPLTKQSIAWAFKRAGIPVRHITLFCRKALLLGITSISCATGSMELDRVQDIFQAAAKRSRLRRLALGLYGSSSSSTGSSQQILVHKALRPIASTSATAAPDRDLENRVSFVSQRLSLEASCSAGGGVKVWIDEAGILCSSSGSDEIQHWLLDPSRMSSVDEESGRASYCGEDVTLEPINGEGGEKEFQLQQEALWLCVPPGMAAHGNVLPLRGIWQKHRKLWLVWKRVPERSLRDVVTRGEKIDLRTVLSIACDVAEGMQFLHECGIIHSNLNSSNILLGDNGSAVIAGLGVEIKSATQDEGSFKNNNNNPWPAAEVDPAISRSAITSNPKTDIFSFGILLRELVSCHYSTDHPSLEAKAPTSQASPSPHPAVPLDCFPLLKYLIHKCCSIDPGERPDFGEILEIIATATRDLTR